jgi:hypothetical protein
MPGFSGILAMPSAYRPSISWPPMPGCQMRRIVHTTSQVLFSAQFLIVRVRENRGEDRQSGKGGKPRALFGPVREAVEMAA